MTLPAPLTPADSDLQDFPFMPLHVARLRDSDLAAEEKPEACWYATLLWAASWHQLPAGSLPNNDAVLTKLIGLGRDTKTFAKHKAGAMRGFVLCDDGRLYHPVVAEQVQDAWHSKLKQRHLTECGRLKKHNQRLQADQEKGERLGECPLPVPSFEAYLSSRTPRPRPDDVPEDKPDCPPGQRLQETGTGTGTVLVGLGTDVPKPSAGRSRRSGTGPTEAEAAAFEAFWAVYPLRKGKTPAQTAFLRIVRGGEATAEQLTLAAQGYAAERAGQDPTKTKFAQGWLNDGRWSDEALPRQSPAAPKRLEVW